MNSMATAAGFWQEFSRACWLGLLTGALAVAKGELCRMPSLPEEPLARHLVSPRLLEQVRQRLLDLWTTSEWRYPTASDAW